MPKAPAGKKAAKKTSGQKPLLPLEVGSLVSLELDEKATKKVNPAWADFEGHYGTFTGKVRKIAKGLVTIALTHPDDEQEYDWPVVFNPATNMLPASNIVAKILEVFSANEVAALEKALPEKRGRKPKDRKTATAKTEAAPDPDNEGEFDDGGVQYEM